MNKITRLAMVGIASVGLMATMNSGASAAPEIKAGPAAAQEWGGGWSDVRDVSIREKPSTTARKVGTLKKGKIVKCWVAGCSGTHNGGAYKCSSSSPTEKDWHEVRWNGKKAWAASRCLEWGRVE
ncbi:SH3 domain-containing protein [Streptomyces purpurascens]|uniref:SH3 domain-containing protein n=1 Tax=Streptomyces purpurascens TaxID=1924 RepID=A0ABZ1MNY1_STREF|nr:SH3 domain-containing protein [Streptomyces purpurascens]MCE7051348.1 SH3 domain-containing protein [Streptomyces purpurascens]